MWLKKNLCKTSKAKISSAIFLVVTLVCISQWYFNFITLRGNEHFEFDYQLNTRNSNLQNNIIVSKPNVQATNEKQVQVLVSVNDKVSFIGLFVNSDVYVPFNFLKSYYEIHGIWLDQSKSRGVNFYWSHTNLADLNPNNLSLTQYNTFKAYMNFKDSDVSNRARVKCISGQYEVPITTQWNPDGYFYPIQIAQYGLSHLSKFYASGGFESSKEQTFALPEDAIGTHKIPVNLEDLSILKLKLKGIFAYFDVKILASDKQVYVLRYSKDKVLIQLKKKSVIVHGMMGDLPEGSFITRDLNVDLVKGLSYREGKKEGLTVNIRIVKVIQIKLSKVEVFSLLKFVEVDHVSPFIAAAEWFVKFQDKKGGWATNVSRTVMKGMKAEAGWYSAMGQGQAISLLCRVYSYTRKNKYLNTALKATQLFNIPSSENGILAMLFGVHPWYEEYPVKPSLFVLNGFIYSLLGLYDLSKTAHADHATESLRLFEQGISSLDALLPLFDNGQGSFYDLRHITVRGHQPNIARWQYHRVHLELLNAIVDITKNKNINRTLTRWINYSLGIRSRHN